MIFICQPYSLTALWSAIRDTSHKRMGPVFCHNYNVGDHCLITHCYFDKCLSSAL